MKTCSEFQWFRSPTMAGAWTTIRHLYPVLYEVPVRTPTDYPVLRFADDWKVARQLDKACARPPLPPGSMPVFDLAYNPEPLPPIGMRGPPAQRPALVRCPLFASSRAAAAEQQL